MSILGSWSRGDGYKRLDPWAQEEAGVTKLPPHDVTPRKPRDWRFWKVALTIAGSLAVFIYVLPTLRYSSGQEPELDTSRLWGQYSPYFPVPSELDSAVPPGCAVTFVQVLSRHGARDPTTHKTGLYNATISDIQRTATSYGARHEFIRDFEYVLGADQLTRLGIEQMIEQGRHVAQRYPGLAGADGPFIRASGQERVIDSAVNWAVGFGEVSGTEPRREDDIVLIPERKGSNNTLDHGLCTAFEEGPLSSVGPDAQNAWAAIFTAPIVARLKANLPGADISRDEAIYLMDLCPFVAVADPDPALQQAHDPERGTTTPAASPFCALFTDDEWRSYDYYHSLGKFYGYGVGNPLGPTQGVGFVNQLVARLTRTPVRDETSSNSTMDGAPETFPLDRTMYADFSHDNTMVSIYAALGLYNVTEGLPKGGRTEPVEAGGFSAGWTVPFAGRMFVEKMTCEGGGEELVRVVVNDRVVPLTACSADDLGRCALGDFVEGLGFARDGGSWDECFV